MFCHSNGTLKQILQWIWKVPKHMRRAAAVIFQWVTGELSKAGGYPWLIPEALRSLAVIWGGHGYITGFPSCLGQLRVSSASADELYVKNRKFMFSLNCPQSLNPTRICLHFVKHYSRNSCKLYTQKRGSQDPFSHVCDYPRQSQVLEEWISSYYRGFIKRIVTAHVSLCEQSLGGQRTHIQLLEQGP